MQIIGLCFNIMNEMCVIWKKVKVWLTLAHPKWIPPSLSAPFGRGELSPAAAPPSPFHFSHSFYARHLLSKQGRQFANSPHSYMIDNRKPLSGADDFFKCLCRPPRVMKKCRPGRLPGSPVPKTATVWRHGLQWTSFDMLHSCGLSVWNWLV